MGEGVFNGGGYEKDKVRLESLCECWNGTVPEMKEGMNDTCYGLNGLEGGLEGLGGGGGMTREGLILPEGGGDTVYMNLNVVVIVIALIMIML